MKQKIIETGKILGGHGFTPGLSGNISMRCDNGFIISTSGSRLSNLKEEDVVFVNHDGSYDVNGKKPSSEKNLHNAIYKIRDDINAIIHCHCPKCTTLAACHIPMNKKLLAECVFYFKEIPVAPYAMPSSDALVQNTAPLFENHNAVLMANHGIIIGADTIENALYLTETAEFNAEVYINSASLNSGCSLTPEQVTEVYGLVR